MAVQLLADLVNIPAQFGTSIVPDFLVNFIYGIHDRRMVTPT